MPRKKLSRRQLIRKLRSAQTRIVQLRAEIRRHVEALQRLGRKEHAEGH